MARWRSLDEYTPIGRLLVDYMWEQRPPLLPSQFAARMGLPKQLVSSWLSGQATPSPAALVHLGRRMEQPVGRLLVAAGYTRETDPLLDIPGAWEHVLNALRQRLHSASEPGQEVKLQELEVLLLAIQEKDVQAWRAEAAAQEAGGERVVFWSRRRRRSEPLDGAGAAAPVEDFEDDGMDESEEAGETNIPRGEDAARS
jgi:transcriptional regulator with XRE-family HTH domain